MRILGCLTTVSGLTPQKYIVFVRCEGYCVYQWLCIVRLWDFVVLWDAEQPHKIWDQLIPHKTNDLLSSYEIGITESFFQWGQRWPRQPSPILLDTSSQHFGPTRRRTVVNEDRSHHTPTRTYFLGATAQGELWPPYFYTDWTGINAQTWSYSINTQL